MVKTKVTRDITNEQCRTPTGKIVDQRDVAIHARATFCTDEWLREHAYTQINEVVVMYIDEDEVKRPASSEAAPLVSPLPGIMSLFSFMVLSPGVLCARSHECCCVACSRVRGRDANTVTYGKQLQVPGCASSKLTCWTEHMLTSTLASGIANRKTRAAELYKKLRPEIRPGALGCVQALERWSTDEEVHLRAGHHWLFEFGDAGDGSSFDRKPFSLQGRAWEKYKGVRFDNGEEPLVVKRWFHRVAADASGRTFVEWDPVKDADPTKPPVPMIVSSSQVRGVGKLVDLSVRVRPKESDLLFVLQQEVAPPALDASARSGARTRGAAVLELGGGGPKHLKLRQEHDNKQRAYCE